MEPISGQSQESAVRTMPKTHAERMELVRKLVAEYTEFQRRRPDVPQGNLWGLFQDDLEKLVTAFQLERDADTGMSDPTRTSAKPQIH
jgi:hypothetical protein